MKRLNLLKTAMKRAEKKGIYPVVEDGFFHFQIEENLYIRFPSKEKSGVYQLAGNVLIPLQSEKEIEAPISPYVNKDLAFQFVLSNEYEFNAQSLIDMEPHIVRKHLRTIFHGIHFNPEKRELVSINRFSIRIEDVEYDQINNKSSRKLTFPFPKILMRFVRLYKNSIINVYTFIDHELKERMLWQFPNGTLIITDVNYDRYVDYHAPFPTVRSYEECKIFIRFEKKELQKLLKDVIAFKDNGKIRYDKNEKKFTISDIEKEITLETDVEFEYILGHPKENPKKLIMPYVDHKDTEDVFMITGSYLDILIKGHKGDVTIGIWKHKKPFLIWD